MRYRIGDATVEVAGQVVVTSFPEGSVRALPNYSAEDRERAVSLGYGEDDAAVDAMTRDHDVIHSLVAVCRGWTRSPVLDAQATGAPSPASADDEERLAMLIARVSNIGLRGVLEDYRVR